MISTSRFCKQSAVASFLAFVQRAQPTLQTHLRTLQAQGEQVRELHRKTAAHIRSLVSSDQLLRFTFHSMKLADVQGRPFSLSFEQCELFLDASLPFAEQDPRHYFALENYYHIVREMVDLATSPRATTVFTANQARRWATALHSLRRDEQSDHFFEHNPLQQHQDHSQSVQEQHHHYSQPAQHQQHYSQSIQQQQQQHHIPLVQEEDNLGTTTVDSHNKQTANQQDNTLERGTDMEQWFSWLGEQVALKPSGISGSLGHIVLLATHAHQSILHNKWFNDGNGRLARLYLNAILICNEETPLLFASPLPAQLAAFDKDNVDLVMLDYVLRELTASQQWLINRLLFFASTT